MHTEACTILATSPNLDEVLDYLRERSCGPVGVVGAGSRWEKMTARIGVGSVTFDVLARRRPGDEFSKMVLSMYNYFRNGSSSSDSLKEEGLDAIASSDTAIGVVADPAFDEEAEEVVIEVARMVGGVIFNGWGILDPEGTVLVKAI